MFGTQTEKGNSSCDLWQISERLEHTTCKNLFATCHRIATSKTRNGIAPCIPPTLSSSGPWIAKLNTVLEMKTSEVINSTIFHQCTKQHRSINMRGLYIGTLFLQVLFSVHFVTTKRIITLTDNRSKTLNVQLGKVWLSNSRIRKILTRRIFA